MKKRIIIAGGGTGGHFYPALSMAMAFKEKGWQVAFAVKKGDICLPALAENELPSIEIDTVALPRSFNPLKHLKFLFKLISSLIYSLRVIKDFSPNAVLGTGSYVAFPIVLAAKIKKIPSFIHESNTVMGISNRLSGIFADKVFLGLPLRQNPFPSKSLLTGTPLRKIFFEEITKQDARKKLGLPEDTFIFLVFGGSQGSENINEAFYKILLDLSIEKKKLNFIQISGKDKFQDMKEKYDKAALIKDNLLFPYYENMPILYAAADAVISRSGSGTICELLHYKKPAILVPLKIAAGDHQTFNAMELARHGCALILKDEESLQSGFKKAILKLLTTENLSAMRKAYERIDIPQGIEPQRKILETIDKGAL
ncbi:MAG: undecaprenyldiphospho-muramoylpentapeptide beta-N-acetylglucosaminyltransferase [Elusimicrobiota bacterium]